MTSRIINHHGNVEEVSASAFTPGPWEATPQDVLNADIYPLTIRSEEWAVAEIYGDVAHISAEANARLIAAAPELYEALEVARGEIARVHQLRSALPQIDAALAKARGEHD